MRDELRIVGPFHGQGGYAAFCRAALTTARLAGYRVQAVESDYRIAIRGYADGSRKEERIPLKDKSKLPDIQAAELREAEAVTVSPDAPTLLIQLPVRLASWGEYSRGPRIGWTMIESDTLHPLWARAAANVDALLLPSVFCLEAFRRALPGVPTSLLPLPVDPRLFAPDGPKADVGNRPEFLFFSSFATSERKGWRLLMQAFTEEFIGESVGLVMLPSRAAEVHEMAAWCRDAGAWIHVLGERVSEEDLAGLYRACDAFALPSAEGFGLPFVEAALCGKPSVALDLGGAAEMVSPDTGYPVYATRYPCIGHIPPLYDSSQRFPSANIWDIRDALRACVEDKASKGEAAREFALSHFTPEAIAPLLREAVEQAECRHEVGRSIWQGTEVSELPKPVCLILSQDVERTRQCAESVLSSVANASVFVLATSVSVESEFPEAFTGGDPANALQEALLWLKSRGFGSYVVLMSDTVTVEPGWWEGLSKVFTLRPDVGILAPKRVFADGQYRVGGHLRFDGSREAGQLQRTIVTCDYVDQSFLCMRPEVWQNVTVDPQFDWFYADADLSVQARLMGWETAATGAVEVTQTRGSREKDYLREPNRMRFLRKWKGRF